MHCKVYILILNWNNWADTINCVRSCLSLEIQDAHLLVIDNGSTDGSEDEIRNAHPSVEVIQTGGNLGFAGGNNVGIKHALARGADYVWLLNNDTMVEPQALAEILKVAAADDKIGMVGSKICCLDKPEILWFAGAHIPGDEPYNLQHTGLGKKDVGQHDEIQQSDYITGCSLLARREMIEAVGVLDAGYFLYFEDADWSVRARKAGWKLVYCPTSKIYHKISASTGGSTTPYVSFYMSRNMLYFVKKNFPHFLVKTFLYNFYVSVLVNLKKRRFCRAGYALKGISSFFLNKWGKIQA